MKKITKKILATQYNPKTFLKLCYKIIPTTCLNKATNKVYTTIKRCRKTINFNEDSCEKHKPKLFENKVPTDEQIKEFSNNIITTKNPISEIDTRTWTDDDFEKYINSI